MKGDKEGLLLNLVDFGPVEETQFKDLVDGEDCSIDCCYVGCDLDMHLDYCEGLAFGKGSVFGSSGL